MAIRPEKLAEILSIPLESAQLILDRRSELSEQELRGRLHEVGPITIEQRNWIWEIHKQCDQLLHQRLASFTAAQSMTLAAFTLLTVARFNADPQKIDPTRIWLLDRSRFLVIAFGVFLAVAGFLVTYPMLKRLKYLNENFLFRDRIYRDYFYSIEWRAEDWRLKKRLPITYGWIISLYRQIIPIWLPIAELMLWISLFALLYTGVRITRLIESLAAFPLGD